MSNFRIDKQTCVKCGQCAMDCPAKIIEMIDQSPVIPAEKEASCYKCQHCFAICPSGALSIHGLDPANSKLLGSKPDKGIDTEQMELLIKGRRSVRRYLPEESRTCADATASGSGFIRAHRHQCASGSVYCRR